MFLGTALAIDRKYASLVHTRFRNAKAIRKVWNFSCPACGDSQKSKTKARGYLYEHLAEVKYKCHNCQAAMPMGIFLKQYAYDLYQEYLVERFKFAAEMKLPEEVASAVKGTPVFYNRVMDVFGIVPSIRSLPEDHFCRRYAMGRKIPEQYWSGLYFVEAFKAFVNLHIPGKFETPFVDEPRLVIPAVGRDGVVSGMVGRSLDGTEPRYYTLKLRDDGEVVFGADRVEDGKTVWVLEGAIDAMMAPNAVALGTSNLERYVGPNTVLVFDNQPRERQIVRLVRKAVDHARNVFIWPENLSNFKDLNQPATARSYPLAAKYTHGEVSCFVLS